MLRAWRGALVVGTVTLVVPGLVYPVSPASAAETAPAEQGAKPSKERFSKAMKRLRDQRRQRVDKSKTKRATDSASPRSTEEKSGASSKADKRAKRKRGSKDRDAKREQSRSSGRKIDLSLPEANEQQPKRVTVEKPKFRSPAPPLPAPKFTELELALKQGLQLQVVDRGPFERWDVSVSNRGRTPIEIAADPRLLSFEARVPGKAKPVSCKLPAALLPRPGHVRRRELAPGEQYSFSVDPLMYCFESGDQTILVPGTFLTPGYGFPERTKTRWSWGRRYEERLEQVAPFAAAYATHGAHAPVGPPPVGETAAEQNTDARGSATSVAAEEGPEASLSREPAPSLNTREGGLKQVLGEGFALRSEYEGWAKAGLHKHVLGDRPRDGLRLSIASGSDAPSARDISVTVKLENRSEVAQRVYFRRDLVSYVIQGPDGEHECEPLSAELRAPDAQAFTTIAPGKSASFTTQLLELCPASSFARAGFYYISAVLPATTAGAYPDEDVFTGKLAASKPRAVRLHSAELPFLLRRGPGGGSSSGVSNAGRFTRSANANSGPEGELIAPLPAPPAEAAPPPEPPPPPPPPAQ